MNGFLSLYGLCLLGISILSFDMLETGVRARGLLPRTRGILYTLALVLGAAFARGFYVLTSPYGRMTLTPAFLSAQPYEYALSGAVLGAIAAALLTAALTRQSAGYVLDAMTPTALVTLALARCAEVFADFGWGAVVEGSLARLPFAVQDAYGQWRLCIFFAEALLALLVLAYAKIWRRKMPGELFSIALCWFSLGHLFLETLRAESICWGFVRVQQLACAVFALGLMMGWHVKNRLSAAQLRDRLLIFAACIGVIVFSQYAMDKLTHLLPVSASYGLMGAALAAMGVAVQRTICASPVNLLIHVKYRKNA